jgi:DNA-binding NarL/FixJ family response regulator
MTVLAEVADSRDALQTASSLTPDLILFSVNDINLKDLDRISALRVEIPSSRIVALITGEFRGQFQSAKDHGAHLVLTKSTPRSELLSAIKSMLKKVIYPAIAQVN